MCNRLLNTHLSYAQHAFEGRLEYFQHGELKVTLLQYDKDIIFKGNSVSQKHPYFSSSSSWQIFQYISSNSLQALFVNSQKINHTKSRLQVFQILLYISALFCQSTHLRNNQKRQISSVWRQKQSHWEATLFGNVFNQSSNCFKFI